jgi:nitrite reductase/ring-hydroxylating ferredoxin subunit
MSEVSDASALGTWVDAGTVAEVRRRRKVVLELGEERQLLVLAHDGGFYAFDNICIHRQRELSKGVILNGRLVCPGHQWAFELATGWEQVKQECQPTYDVRVVDEVVQVDTSSRQLRRTAAPGAVSASEPR